MTIKRNNKKLVENCIRLHINEMKNLVEIGKIVGLKADTVSLILKANNIKVRSTTAKIFSDEQINECVDLYLNGKSMKTISTKFNVNPEVISKILRKNNIKIKPKNTKIIVNDLKILELYNSGLTIEKISKLKGISCWAISLYLKENNIKTRTSSHPDRIEISRKHMVERIKKYNSIKIGNKEEILIELLKQKYNEVIPQFQIEKGGHHFDVFSGGILWELDEKRHRWKRQIEKDIRYDKRAKELGYEVRRISELDIHEHKLEKWHNYQNLGDFIC